MSLRFDCPVCYTRTDSRNVFRVDGTNELVRRRTCPECGYGFYTRQPREEVLENFRVWHPSALRAEKIVRLVPDHD